MEQVESNKEVVNETLSDAGASPSYSADQAPINADHVSIDDVRVDSDEDSPVVGAASVEKTDDAPTALEVTASQASPTMDEISAAVGVAPTTGSADPAAATDHAAAAATPKKPKTFSIARVDACVLSMWEHVNAGSHDVIEEIEKLLGIKE